MTKGNDSREFFELFKPQQKADTAKQRDEQRSPEAADAAPQQVPVVPEVHNVAEPVVAPDPLKWIKDTRQVDSPQKERQRTALTPPGKPDTQKYERVLRKDEVVLRQETLIIGAIAATLLSIACFFVGHKVGYNKGVLNQTEEWLETIEPQDAKKSFLGQPKPVEAPQPHKPANKPAPAKVEKQEEHAKQVAKDSKIKEKQAEAWKQPVKDKWTLRAVAYKNTKENIEKTRELAKTILDALGYDSFVVNTGKELFVCVGEFESNDSGDLMKAQKALAELKYDNRKPFDGCYPIRMR